MEVYHYTKLENWHRISNGSMYGDEPGFKPTQLLSPHTENGRNIRCSFSLLEPEPEQWTRNNEYPHIWTDLMAKTGELLLEVDVSGCLDDTYVVDFEPREAFARRQRRGEEVDESMALDAEKRYVESMVPLQDYLEEEQELNYQLPEAIVTERLPMKAVKVSDQQPKIERKLNKWPEGCGNYRRIRRQVAQVPELRSWAQQNGDIGLLKAIEKAVEIEREYGEDY